HVEVEKELSVLAAFFEAGQIFQDFGSASVIALRGVGTRFNGNGGDVRGIELQRFIGQLFAFRVVGASERTLCSRNVGLNGFRTLAHRLIEIGEANLNAQIIRLGQEKLFQKRDGFGLAIILQVNFRELKKERARLAHYALLDVEIGEALERANFFGR